ncbi:ribosome biogenesis/translation initiation ATPase RLI [Candidatus Woesearchaeota archaeon]|nr:ribosome biogenesis/translation initiation ATPase RLI [Candidatus Woesearchaeota archaeon]
MKRLAIIDKNKCHPDKCGNYWCISVCPVNRANKECIIIAEDKKAAIIEEACIGCGLCLKCPFDAIQIVNLPEKLKQDPIHRYGQNMFELFSLPIPKQNTVVGILGRNGIGKSTALQIFANQITPNLGNYDKEPENKITERYSKSFLGDYFKKLYNNQIKISYKPQRIELLPKIYKGKVIDLIKKIDEKNISDKLIKELELTNVINRNIDELSGGELQRLAILASLSKKAELIILDEPCAFLDIPQRIKVAKLIRKLSENTSILVVEHDLAILDYISDEIQIFYGEQAAYGIVSQSKTVKRGINEYLDGFLPDDNVRFRNYQIRFTKSHEERTVKQEIILEYPEITKTFKDFKLNISKGEVKKRQILGIMGQNGLGKSTFLKILSGQLEADKGKLENTSISLKPQQLTMFKGTVEEFLSLDNESYSSSWFQSNIEKLGLNRLKNNKANELSGGELQKVHIMKCLSKDARIFALDEPSAFIDVEDRLNVSKVIKDFIKQKDICALVVDHDFQFMDYLSDSILIFEGIPGKSGKVDKPLKKEEGMNKILKILDITYRKDQETGRARINKPNSQKDIQQKKDNVYYEL